ncbi:hypothetical protein EJJ20_25985 [Pseudomonas poae]|nr:hypothetical protein EJJ20_25985 [Pseudomonas poae]
MVPVENGPPQLCVHHSLAIRLRGSLDVPALQRSFDALVARHESLRTVFVEAEDGRVSPQIQPPSALSLTVQALPDASPEALDRVVEAQMAQPLTWQPDLWCAPRCCKWQRMITCWW